MESNGHTIRLPLGWRVERDRPVGVTMYTESGEVVAQSARDTAAFRRLAIEGWSKRSLHDNGEDA